MITNPTPRAKSRRSVLGAFTLIEVAVACAVIGVTMTGIFGVLSMGLSISESSRENLRATQIMLDKMEGVRLYDWDQINNASFLASTFTNWFFETNNIGMSTAQGYGIKYTGNIAVSSVPFTNVYSSGMVQVTVTVNWNSAGCGWEAGRLSHTRTMTTYVSQAGIQNYVFNSN